MQFNKKTHNKYRNKGHKVFKFLRFGNIGIKAFSSGRLLEEKWLSIQIALQRKFKADLKPKQIKIWRSLEFNNSLTKLSLESRMGKGKGSVCSKSKFIKSGTILFEFDKLPQQYHELTFRFIQSKLPLKLKLVQI